MGIPFSRGAPYTDERGAFVSLFSPCFQGGRVRALLCLDYDLSFTGTPEQRAYIALVTALGLAILVSEFVAFWCPIPCSGQSRKCSA